MSTENVDWGRIPLAEAIDHVKMSLLKLRQYKPGRLMTVPEDLVQVLESMIERDPDKGAEILKAGFEARLTELYHQWQVLRISTARYAEFLGVSPWELTDLLCARGLKTTNLPA